MACVSRPCNQTMALGMAEIEQALLSLTPDARAVVIERGLLSLEDVDDAPQAEVAEAWRVEIQRRVDDHLHGGTELVDADERCGRSIAARRTRRREGRGSRQEPRPSRPLVIGDRRAARR